MNIYDEAGSIKDTGCVCSAIVLGMVAAVVAVVGVTAGAVILSLFWR